MNTIKTWSAWLLAGCLTVAGPAPAAGTAPTADTGTATAPLQLAQQWPPEGGQGYPMEPGMQPGGMQPEMQPGQPGMPPGMPPGQPMQQPYAGGQTINDPMGHYHLTLPRGAAPVGSTLNFTVPSAGVQVSVSSFAQAQMVQMYAQNFPTMMQRMGATIDTQQPINHHGEQGHLIGATMRNAQGGGSVHAMTVFLPQSGVMVQVMGPEQNAQQIGNVMTEVLNNLR